MVNTAPNDNWKSHKAIKGLVSFSCDNTRAADSTVDRHPSVGCDVAISSSGIVYISDGYCNSRIMIFSPEGHFITQFGLSESMAVPHSLTLLENEDLICVADRENRRILCYTAGLSGERRPGKLVFNVQHKLMGKVYAVDHIGDILIAVNGPEANGVAPKGLSLDLATEQLVDIWEPTTEHFDTPHDLAVSADSTSFFSFK
ncbi:unnamed protein product [Medioppia subpectinata]|uniref:Uncharacterized protein n=1 Tax=Medioppia subpectinata TaxID=1979941 RepID=A0A7R9KEK9_9ACAR|nr:unnamed protein product [Medioppia subpectinata]CAG2100721.1 unnamed protein product [Medioppia subpectinata]